MWTQIILPSGIARRLYKYVQVVYVLMFGYVASQKFLRLHIKSVLYLCLTGMDKQL